MGNTLTLIVNKIQYEADKYLRDPEADNHAKQLAAQAIQNKKIEQAKLAKSITENEENAKANEDKIAADALAKRSEYSPPLVILAKISKNILNTFIALIIFGLALYGGKIEANKAIGYNIPMRIVSFIYGALFFFIVIPKSLYEIYWLKKTIPDYTLLPIWNYVPNGWAEQIFLGQFSYIEDNNSKIAREQILHLYSDALKNSIGLATSVGAAINKINTSAKQPSNVKEEKPAPGVPVAIVAPNVKEEKPAPGVPVAIEV